LHKPSAISTEGRLSLKPRHRASAGHRDRALPIQVIEGSITDIALKGEGAPQFEVRPLLDPDAPISRAYRDRDRRCQQPRTGNLRSAKSIFIFAVPQS
jgi:hypothetical protein